jgi:hypothetical protein
MATRAAATVIQAAAIPAGDTRTTAGVGTRIPVTLTAAADTTGIGVTMAATIAAADITAGFTLPRSATITDLTTDMATVTLVVTTMPEVTGIRLPVALTTLPATNGSNDLHAPRHERQRS